MESQTYSAQGWDREPILSDKRRAAFLFRDTNHISLDIHLNLLSEIESSIAKKLFDHLLIEGGEGEYSPNFERFESEESLIQYLTDMRAGGYSFAILHQRNITKNTKIYGIDDNTLMKEQIQIIAKKNKICSRYLKSEIKDDDVVEYLKLIEQSKIMADTRTLKAAENIDDYMNSNNIRSAGILFGNRHHELLVSELERRDIEVFSYFPGINNPSEMKSLEYNLSIVERSKRKMY